MPGGGTRAQAAEEFAAFGEAKSIPAVFGEAKSIPALPHRGRAPVTPGVLSSRPLSLISITNLCPEASAARAALIHRRREGRSLQPGHISAWGYLGIQPCYRGPIKG